jgi:predicted ATPase
MSPDRFTATGPIPWVRRVRLRNYKSIATCDVPLGPLTVLVGPNGSGKSNFLDALAFVADAVALTPHQAIDARGGLGELLRRTPEPTGSFSVKLDLRIRQLPGQAEDQWVDGWYGFEIEPGNRPGRRPVEVVREECQFRWSAGEFGFRVDRGAVSDQSLPLSSTTQRIEADRLYLPLAGARPDFAAVAGQLSNMAFYNFDLQTLRQLQPKTARASLGGGGEHLGDVLGALDEEFPTTKERIDSYLSAVAPYLDGIDRSFAGSYVTVEARTKTGPNGAPVLFGPDSISDGTIRAAGLLAALFQPTVLTGQTSLVGIEEPEVALHPAAAGVLFDALTEAAEQVQVIATTQSDDLLDRDDLDPSIIRAVGSQAGLTVIGNVNRVSLQAIHERRFTAGELMRAGQVFPDSNAGATPPDRQVV